MGLFLLAEGQRQEPQDFLSAFFRKCPYPELEDITGLTESVAEELLAASAKVKAYACWSHGAPYLMSVLSPCHSPAYTPLTGPFPCVYICV